MVFDLKSIDWRDYFRMWVYGGKVLKGGASLLSSHITAIDWYNDLLWHMHFSGAYRWYFVPWVLCQTFCFGSYLEKECNDVAVCRVWLCALSWILNNWPMVHESLKTRLGMSCNCDQALLLVVRDAVKSGDELNFLMSKNYSWKICYLQILLFSIYQL